MVNGGWWMVDSGWWMVKVTDCNKIINSNGNKKDIPGARDTLHLKPLAAAATVAVVVDPLRLVMVVVALLSRGWCWWLH